MDISGTRIDISKKLKEYVESKRNQDGTAVGVAFIKDGELVSAFVCGTQDGNPDKPATVNDLFDVGSISKLYCALAIMKLVEMGKVCLDTPLIEYLPRFTMKDERYKQITLRMCLNHSSGLPGTNLKYSFNTKWLDETLYDDFYDCFSKSKLKDNPGNASVYCNDGFMLAEMVVAEVTSMSYIKFLQEYITIPASAFSVCAAGNIPENHIRIKAKGKTNEYCMNTAAGGILTSIIDCARIGYLFIDSKGILTDESLKETTYSQGKSFLPRIAGNFGLGWHFVDFSLDPYDMGKNTLAQGGGSASFGSFLIVSKKHNLAAAISLSFDNKLNPNAMLNELCGILLDEYGINTKKQPKETATEADKKAIPNGFKQKFSGMYYNCMNSYNVSFDGNSLKLQMKLANGWKDIAANAYFDGQCFISGKRMFSFETHGSNSYLIEEEVPLWGRNPMGQKCTSFPLVNTMWKNRVGKKYIAIDAHPHDMASTSGGFAITIKEFNNEEGLLFFEYAGPFGVNLLPVIATEDNETEMFLNTPVQGSREGFAPFIYEKDSIEYLYAFGYNLVDTAYLKPLQTGQVISEKGRKNKIFTLTGGNKINIDIPNGVRIIIFGSDLKPKYDSASGQKINETCDGFITFINEGSMDVSVEVCPL